MTLLERMGQIMGALLALFFLSPVILYAMATTEHSSMQIPNWFRGWMKWGGKTAAWAIQFWIVRT